MQRSRVRLIRNACYYLSVRSEKNEESDHKTGGFSAVQRNSLTLFLQNLSLMTVTKVLTAVLNNILWKACREENKNHLVTRLFNATLESSFSRRWKALYINLHSLKRIPHSFLAYHQYLFFKTNFAKNVCIRRILPQSKNLLSIRHNECDSRERKVRTLSKAPMFILLRSFALVSEFIFIDIHVVYHLEDFRCCIVGQLQLLKHCLNGYILYILILSSDIWQSDKTSTYCQKSKKCYW